MNWKEAEELAADYLKKKGYKILRRNYRAPFGEIDIIALRRKTLIFVEVKSGSGRIRPLARIDKRKVKRMLATAQYFILHEKIPFKKLRFDVIEITPHGITHIEEVNF